MELPARSHLFGSAWRAGCALACVLLACWDHRGGCVRAQTDLGAVKTVKDLKAVIYTEMSFGQGAGDACVRLLHASGTVGCAAPGRSPVQGRLVRLQALPAAPEEYPDGATLLVPPSLLAGLLQQCQASAVVAARVAGVLVEPQPAPAYSQAGAAPLAEFALYANRSYAWNPTGAGLNDMALPFPVLLLDDATAENARQRAAYNADQGMNGALNYAKATLHMDASGNSSACLKAQACLPLGGHSVVAALPPLPAPPPGTAGGGGSGSGSDDLPAVWILSQFDSTALFHEAAVGAEAAVSGLIAMLAAAEALGSAALAASAAGGAPYAWQYRRRLVFAALGGEPWGLMGSKRLLWEMAAGNRSVAGLGISEGGGLAGVLEVSQVGRARQEGGGVQLFTHTPAGGDAASAELLAALSSAAANSSEASPAVALSPASSGTPGLPPTASAGSFVRVTGSGGGTAVPAVLLAGFDASFQGSTFQSQFDTIDTVDADSIAAAAVVLARAAHVLALGAPAGTAGEAAAELPVNYTIVKGTVDALMQCLLNSTVGLNCPLAAAMMSPTGGGAVPHYIGVLRTLTADPQTPDPAAKSDLERFLWNYLAFALAPVSASGSTGGASTGGAGSGSAGSTTAGVQRCQPMNATGCPPGLVCAGSRSLPGADGYGYCLNATARYVPSYSTSLDCNGCQGGATSAEWQLTDAAAQWEEQHDWPADPVWTESNWPQGTPALTLYLREDPGVENALLAAGLVVAAGSVAATLGLRWAHHRKLKRQ